MKLFHMSCFHAARSSLELHWGCEPLYCAPLTPASDVSLAPERVNSEPRLWENPHLPVQVCTLSLNW